MFKNISNISGISSKVSHLAKFARTRTVLAAAVATTSLGLVSTTRAALTQPTDISSIAYSATTGGSTTTLTGVNSVSGNSESPFYPSSNKYTLTYDNDVDALTSVVAGGTQYNVTGQMTATLRVNSTFPSNMGTVWEQGSSSSTTVTMDGTKPTSVGQVLSTNNILVGSDNIFSNTGDPNGDNDQVVRVDLLLSSPLTASESTAFAVYDRGLAGQHDAFEIAAITGETNGVPTSYGPLRSYSEGSWGNTNLISATQQEDIIRQNVSSGSAFQPSTNTDQSIGGILIPTGNLVAAGTTIYGYSLFSAEANGTSSQLTQYTNTSYFPEASYASNEGGLDPVDIGAVYTAVSAVPEPTSAALLTVAVGGLMARRPKRTLA
jgi:hypothetical protein